MKRTYFTVKRDNKYHNRSCNCISGHWHQSNGEAQYCNDLALLVKAKEIKSYEIQKQFSLDVNGKHITNYRMDFVITENDGSLRCAEYKGFETEVYRLKAKLFQALYPDLRYEVVYHREPYNVFKKYKGKQTYKLAKYHKYISEQ